MTADPPTPPHDADEHDATDAPSPEGGRSSPDPAEGADDAPPGGDGAADRAG